MNRSIGYFLHDVEAPSHIVHASFLIRRHGSEFHDTDGTEVHLALFAGNRWRGQSGNPRTPAADRSWCGGGGGGSGRKTVRFCWVGGQGRRDDDKWNGDNEFDDGHEEKQTVIPLNEEMVIQKKEAILLETRDKKEMREN